MNIETPDVQNPNHLRHYYHGKGMSQSDMESVFDCSTSTISRWMRRLEIKTSHSNGRKRGDPLFENEKETLRRLYWDEGLTTGQIANRCNSTKPTVVAHMKDHGIERRNSAADRPPGVYIHPELHPAIYHYDGEKRHTVKVHRLLAVAKYGFDAVKGKDVHHNSGFKQDNRWDAIELHTRSEHQKLHPYGVKPIVIDSLEDAVPP